LTETNNCIIVFQFYNTKRCPVPKMKLYSSIFCDKIWTMPHLVLDNI